MSLISIFGACSHGRLRGDFSAERRSGTLGFQLSNGTEIAGRCVVLCLGIGNASLPVEPSGNVAPGRSRIVRNPWRLSWLRRVAPMDSVCILGSSLTMIDQVLALRAHGHRGVIDVLSRRGLIPLDHTRTPRAPLKIDVEALPSSVSAILRALREQARNADDWRCVMDGLRPVTQDLWKRLALVERYRFLRHALPWWNIHRHRVAPDIFEMFISLVHDGTVRMQAGFLKSIEMRGADGIVAKYRMRGLREIAEIRAGWLGNCIGMERADIGHSPLLNEMARVGWIAPDPLRLGIQVNDRSEVEPQSGNDHAPLFAVGALTARQFWEITAVPGIRVQAQAIAVEISEGYSTGNDMPIAGS